MLCFFAFVDEHLVPENVVYKSFPQFRAAVDAITQRV